MTTGSIQISNEKYHADGAISASMQKVMASHGPKAFYNSFLNPERPERKPTAAMLLGTLTHCAVLDPDELTKRFVAVSSRTTKKGKEEEIGFIVIPVTEAGTNLCVSRGSHKVEYCKKEGDQCIPADFSNDAPPIEIPFGYAMMCSRNLAHAGARTGPDQPPDGRPRIHVYCMDKTGSTFPVRHEKNWMLPGPARAIKEPHKLLPEE